MSKLILFLKPLVTLERSGITTRHVSESSFEYIFQNKDVWHHVTLNTVSEFKVQIIQIICNINGAAAVPHE